MFLWTCPAFSDEVDLCNAMNRLALNFSSVLIEFYVFIYITEISSNLFRELRIRKTYSILETSSRLVGSARPLGQLGPGFNITPAVFLCHCRIQKLAPSKSESDFRVSLRQS